MLSLGKLIEVKHIGNMLIKTYERSDLAPVMISVLPRKIRGLFTAHQGKGREAGHPGYGF